MTIYESIAAIMNEIPAIGKNQRNAKQGFMYRGIDDVMNALQPLLSKHKVFVVPEMLDHEREERKSSGGGNLIYSICTVKYTFYAEDGSNVSAVVIGEGMDSGDKATNKAMAIALKYAFFQVFCIPTEEMKDPDADTPDPSEPKGKAEPKHTKAERPPIDGGEGDYMPQCSECGETITPRVHDYSVEKFNKPLCMDCQKKARAS